MRDPIGICVEMMHIAKACYVATPPEAIELTRGVKSPDWCGWQHDRWMVERSNGGLVFVAKPHHIHSPFCPAVRSSRFLIAGASEPQPFERSGLFPVREAVLVDAEDVERELRRIVASSTRPDPIGAAMRRGRKHASTLYCEARRLLTPLRRA